MTCAAAAALRAADLSRMRADSLGEMAERIETTTSAAALGA